jgi:16S rRNA processing protein RimM
MPDNERTIKDQPSGSPQIGEPEFLAVGKLRRPHGVRGEMLMSVWTDFPERLKPGINLYVGDQHKLLVVQDIRWHRQDILIMFDSYEDRETIGSFRNQVLYVRVEDLPPLEEDEFYLHELIGLKVIREDNGDCLGSIADILETGANDVYVVHTQKGTDVLIPAVDPVISEIDLENGEVRIRVIPGLLPDE